MIWTCIEPGLYLITACLPSFRPLLGHLIPRLWARVSANKASRDVERPYSGTDQRRENFQKLREDTVPNTKRQDSITKLGLYSLDATPSNSSNALPLVNLSDIEANPATSTSANAKGRTIPIT